MSPTSSLIVDGIAMPHKLRGLVQASKPVIRIHLTTKNRTYTTLDRIEGVVTVTAPVDTHFDALDIEFAGSSRTFVERLTTSAAVSGRSEAFHQFLKLTQPGLQRLYPEDGILKAGETYEFPFVFAVPQQLLPRVCRHPVLADTVRDAHLRLPPTFGDKDLLSQPGALDDQAPEMASVRYGVFVKLSSVKIKGEETWRSTLAAKARRVRVIPAVEEQPPLDVHEEDGEYVMRKEKNLRKTILSTSRSGGLVVEAAQPTAFHVRSFNNPDSRTDSVAHVMLRFDPSDEKALPPKLGTLASKLKVSTFFGCTARRHFPAKNNAFMDLTQGVHTENVSLFSRSMAGVEWKKHRASDSTQTDSDNDASSPTIERRDSANSTISIDAPTKIPSPSAFYKPNSAFYTAHIVVPVTLPAHKAFPPTFHSCLISRVYALKLELSLPKTSLSSSLDLKLPVQIMSEDLIHDEFSRSAPTAPGATTTNATNAGGRSGSQSWGSVDFGSIETEVEGEDVSAFFEPRVVRPVAEGFVGRSRIGSTAPTGEEDMDLVARMERQREQQEQREEQENMEDEEGEVHREAQSGGEEEDEQPPGYEALMHSGSAGQARYAGMTLMPGRGMSVSVH